MTSLGSTCPGPLIRIVRMKEDPAENRVLRAKYLDWCSARIADRFLELTPDQIYELAHPASDLDGTGAADRGTGGVSFPVADGATAAGSEMAPAAQSYSASSPSVLEDDLGYRTLVERVTEVLAIKLRLPSFEEWVAAYRASPDRFDEEILGFWHRGD